MNKILNKVVWLIIAAPVIYLAIIWNTLPGTIVTHFNISGDPDRMGSKNVLLWVVTILIFVNIALYLLLSNVHKIDPKRYGEENRERLQRMAFAISLFMTGIGFYFIYLSKVGGSPFNANIIFGSIGLLWCILGNYMHNIRPNYFAGYRMRWTLNDKENWRKTHILAGKLWFAGGLLLAILCLFSSREMAPVYFLCITLMLTILPALYSYRLHKHKNSQY